MPVTPSNSSASEPPSSEVRWNHGQRRQMVAQLLISDIFQGELKGGTRLIIKSLATRYNVSPTPVREALVWLEGIGLAHVEPNRGAVVRNLTDQDAREISQVRKTLECEATRLACGRISIPVLNELAQEFEKIVNNQKRPRDFGEKARELDSRLHDQIAESCGNRFLREEIGRFKLLFRAFRDYAWQHQMYGDDPSRFLAEASEHLKIVQALLRGDRKEAAREMARHIRAGVKYWSHAVPPL